jgi:hypothetical protein
VDESARSEFLFQFPEFRAISRKKERWGVTLSLVLSFLFGGHKEKGGGWGAGKKRKEGERKE